MLGYEMQRAYFRQVQLLTLRVPVIAAQDMAWRHSRIMDGARQSRYDSECLHAQPGGYSLFDVRGSNSKVVTGHEVEFCCPHARPSTR